MQKNIIYLSIAIMIVLSACKKGDEYKSFIPNGEKVYPGIDTAITYHGGNNRGLLEWPASPDQRTSKYVVYWNNRADSIIINAASHNPKDTVKALIDNLAEGTYTFIINSFDNNGNRSVDVEKNNARVYGPIYQGNLLNRAINNVTYGLLNKLITINWRLPDAGNTVTNITYTGSDGLGKTIKLSPDSTKLQITNWKKDTKIYYQSFYKPNALAIDTFAVLNKDSLVVDSKSGNYMAVGSSYNYNADGSYAGVTPFNFVKQLAIIPTSGLYVFDDVGQFANLAKTQVFLMVNPDNTIDVSGYVSVSAPIVNHPTAGKSYYDPVTGNFVLRYKYTNTDGTVRLIEEIWSPN